MRHSVSGRLIFFRFLQPAKARIPISSTPSLITSSRIRSFLSSQGGAGFLPQEKSGTLPSPEITSTPSLPKRQTRGSLLPKNSPDSMKSDSISVSALASAATPFILSFPYCIIRTILLPGSWIPYSESSDNNCPVPRFSLLSDNRAAC